METTIVTNASNKIKRLESIPSFLLTRRNPLSNFNPSKHKLTPQSPILTSLPNKRELFTPCISLLTYMFMLQLPGVSPPAIIEAPTFLPLSLTFSKVPRLICGGMWWSIVLKKLNLLSFFGWEKFSMAVFIFLIIYREIGIHAYCLYNESSLELQGK